MKAGKPAEAEPLLREGIAEMQANISQRPPWDGGALASAFAELERLCKAQGKTAEAARWRSEREKHAKPAAKAAGG